MKPTLTVALLLGFALTGCGSDERPAMTAETKASQTAATSTSPTEVPSSEDDTDGDGVLDVYDIEPEDPAIGTADDLADEDETEELTSECEIKEISGDSIPRKERKEGVCTGEDGVRVKVVDRRTKLTLPQLDVEYTGYNTDETLSASTGTEKASGTYVTLNLTVTNKLDAPVTFEPEQVVLGLGDAEYTTDFDAMNMPGQSFVWESDEIQPGNTKTGTLTFDVPPKAVAKLATSGNISIRQFSDADLFEDDEPESTVGVIRTYK